MTIHNNIQGIFKLNSPMHVADTGEYSLNDNGYIVRKTAGMNNVTATMRQNVLADGARVEIPYFPANDLRGRLRRKAAALVMEALVANGEKVPVDLYAGLCAGAVGGQPESNATIEEIKRASDNVYMGLFGGGTRMLRSRYSAQDAVPIIRATVKAGLVPEGFGPYADKNLPLDSGSSTGQSDGYRLTDIRHVIRVDDVTRVLRAEEIEAFVENAAEAVAGWQAGVMQNRSDRKSKDENASDTKKSDLANVVSVQSIIPGTELYVRFDTQDGVTDAQRGLLLCALRDLINEQALGGWVRTGFGKFAAEHFTATIDGEEHPVFELNEARGTYKLTSAMDGYVHAMKKELESLNVAGLMEFFTNKVEKAKKGKKAQEAA